VHNKPVTFNTRICLTTNNNEDGWGGFYFEIVCLERRKYMNIEELLAKAKKPSADAMRLHPFYRGKIQTALKCTVHSFADFAIWYTPGVAAGESGIGI
jgi:hypothetical protein